MFFFNIFFIFVKRPFKDKLDMKPYNYIVLILCSISNYVFAQSGIGNQQDSLRVKNNPIMDSINFKRLGDSLCYESYKPFSKEFSHTTINKQVYQNLKFKPLPKQQVYFSIHDYTAGYHLTPVSQYENPFFDNTKQLRFLWSGHAAPYREIGAPENYLRSNQAPPLIIKFIRGRKGVEGIWLERLRPEFHRIP